MDALLLVDIQKDFLPGGSLAVPEGDRIIPVVNRLVRVFPLVVATQDWHPSDHGSFASHHPGKEPFETTDLNGLEQTLWPDHCVQGSAGAAFADMLDMNPVEAIFRKGTDPGIDSYSGFFDNGHRKSTGMADYLRGRDVDTVYVTGLAGDVCVWYTARDALTSGFRTILVADAARPLDEKAYAVIQDELLENGAQVMDSSQLA